MPGRPPGRVEGALPVARFMLGLFRRAQAEATIEFVPVLVNGEVGLVGELRATPERLPTPMEAVGEVIRLVMAFDVVDGRIVAIYDQLNPEKLSGRADRGLSSRHVPRASPASAVAAVSIRDKPREVRGLRAGTVASQGRKSEANGSVPSPSAVASQRLAAGGLGHHLVRVAERVACSANSSSSSRSMSPHRRRRTSRSRSTTVHLVVPGQVAGVVTSQ